MNYNKNYIINQDINKETKKYKDFSISKHKTQEEYLSKKFFVSKTDIIEVKHDIFDSIKNYYQTKLQQVFTIEQLSIEKKLTPILLTFTLPSKFHPYTSYKRNNKFIRRNNPNYDSENSITDGKNYLQEIWRTFYKRSKNYNNSKMYFTKVFEPHKTHIPHLHVILYIEKDKIEIMRKLFNKVCKEFKLKEVDFKDNIKYVGSYVRKYLVKNLTPKTKKDREFIKYLDGWKRQNKIRIIETSNTGLNLFLYKKLYYNLPKIIKENIIKNIKDEMSLMKYLLSTTKIKKEIRDMKTGEIFYKENELKQNPYYEIEVIQEKRYRILNDDYNSYKSNMYLEREEIEKHIEYEEHYINNEVKEQIYYSINRVVIKDLKSKKVLYDTYEDGFVMWDKKTYYELENVS